MAAMKILFVGAGKMGGAILCALAENGYPASSIYFYEPDDAQAKKIAAQSKAERVTSLSETFSKVEGVFLCLKPQVFSKSYSEISKELEKSGKDPILISIMAGISLSSLRKIFPKSEHIVRTMPNIAIMAKEGMIAIVSEGVEESILRTIEFLFSTCANTVRISEAQIDAVTGISGSGPAFVFQFIMALVMGGVKTGLTWDAAMKLALSTVSGAVAMLKFSKLNIAELTADICSPAGTTIAGIHELENRAFKGTVMAAVEAAAKRSAELGK